MASGQGRMRFDRASRQRRQAWLSGLTFLLVLLVGAGCAHQQAYKRGTRLSEEGRYEKAIAELEEAVALARESHNEEAVERYSEKLEAVKGEAAQFFYVQAEDRFADTDLGTAQMLIERCVEYRPQEQPYWAFRQRVNQAVADAEQMRTAALSLAEQGQWQAGLERMGEALQMYRTLPGGRGDLEQIQERAYRHHLTRAEACLRDGDLEGAQAEAQEALAYRETGRDARVVLETVKDRREAAGWIERGRKLLEQGECEEALRALERANRLHPSHAELPDLLGRARRSVCDRWLSRGREAMEAGQYAAALRLFRRSRDLLASYGGVNALAADAQTRLSDAHLELSQDYLGEGLSGCAVLHAAVALAYQPENFDARRRLGQCAGQIRADIRYTIEFAGFQTAAELRGPAQTLSAVVLEHLSHTRPANVLLVERSNSATGLDGQGIEPSPGSDALLVGQVLDYKVTQESKQTGEGESVYQDGFRAEPNPDYVQAAQELDAALTALERARKRLLEAEGRLRRYERAAPDDAAAQARRHKAREDVAAARRHLVRAATDVGAAEARVASIPPEVLVPNMVKHHYPIQSVTWTARMNCMVKMVDAATGEVILAERLEGKHTDSDAFVSGDPARNVPEDPLVLPGDAVLMEKAVNAVAEKVKRSLDTACKKHGSRFYVQMRRAEADGAAAEAVDGAVKYLFAYPTGYEHTKRMVAFARAYLGDEDELMNVREPLEAHCQIKFK